MTAHAVMAVLVAVATAAVACATCGVGRRPLIFGMATLVRVSGSGTERSQLLVMPFDININTNVTDIFFAIIGSIIGNITATAAFANKCFRIFSGAYDCQSTHFIFNSCGRC
jgi:hypothetical protein